MTKIQATGGIEEGGESKKRAESSQKDRPKDGEHGSQYRGASSRTERDVHTKPKSVLLGVWLQNTPEKGCLVSWTGTSKTAFVPLKKCIMWLLAMPSAQRSLYSCANI